MSREIYNDLTINTVTWINNFDEIATKLTQNRINIFLEEGTYPLALIGALTLSANTTIKSNGRAVISAEFTNLINITGDNVILENLIFDCLGNDNNAVNAINISANHTKIKNCIFINKTQGAMISINNAQNFLTVSNCVFNDNTMTEHFIFNKGATNVVVSECTFYGTNAINFQNLSASSAGDVLFENNTVNGGHIIINGNNNKIRNNNFKLIEQIDMTDGNNNIFENNKFISPVGNYIFNFNNSNNIIVKNNYSNDSGTTGYLLASVGGNVIVDSNSCHNFRTIAVSGTCSADINNNMFRSTNNSNKINFTSSGNLNLYNNIFTNNSGTCISSTNGAGKITNNNITGAAIGINASSNTLVNGNNIKTTTTPINISGNGYVGQNITSRTIGLGSNLQIAGTTTGSLRQSTISGSGTSWNNGSLVANDIIMIGYSLTRIVSINSATSMTISPPIYYSPRIFGITNSDIVYRSNTAPIINGNYDVYNVSLDRSDLMAYLKLSDIAASSAGHIIEIITDLSTSLYLGVYIVPNSFDGDDLEPYGIGLLKGRDPDSIKFIWDGEKWSRYPKRQIFRGLIGQINNAASDKICYVMSTVYVTTFTYFNIERNTTLLGYWIGFDTDGIPSHITMTIQDQTNTTITLLNNRPVSGIAGELNYYPFEFPLVTVKAGQRVRMFISNTPVAVGSEIFPYVIGYLN